MKRSENPNMLVVERDRNVARILEAFLSQIGDVAVASNLQDAMDMFTRIRPDIVVINNLDPPEREGIDVIKMLKRIDPEVKILVYTSFPSAVEEALEAGADDFAIKPLNKHDLIRFVERNL